MIMIHNIKHNENCCAKNHNYGKYDRKSHTVIPKFTLFPQLEYKIAKKKSPRAENLSTSA